MTQEIDELAIWGETDELGNLVADTDPQPPGEDPEDPNPSDLDLLEEPAPEDPAPEPTPEPEPTPQDEVDYKALWTKAQDEVKTMHGRLRAEQDRAAQALAAQQLALAAQQTAAPVEPSEEDQAIERFRSEYSEEVVRAIDILTTRKAQAVANELLASRVAPVEQTTAAMIEQAHFAAIEAAHPDVYAIDESPEFNAWIESRPMHNRAAYQAVRERGTPAEVISMLNEYKGTQTTSTKPAAPVQERPTPPLAVQRRRGTVNTAPEAAITDERTLWDSIPD